jgi:hypothetical protein
MLRKGKRIELVIPDLIALYGDARAYWIQENEGQKVLLCCRNCAVEFANERGSVLVRASDGACVYPEQAEFDQYAHDHNLTHCLAVMDEDEWVTAELEFQGLMRARLQYPDRLLALACVLADVGKLKLAE